DQQAQVLAAWVVEKDYKKVAVVYTNNAWGEGLAKAFQKYYTELSDGQISLFEATEEGETDFRTVLAKIKAQGCDAIMSPTYPKEGGALVKQAKELGIGSALYGADNWGAPEFLQIAGSAADGSFFVAQYSYDGPEFQHLNTKFKKLTGKETDADVFVAYGYDTVYAIAHALTPAKSLNGPDIRQALLEVKFQGASGLIEFAPNGDLKTSAFVKKIISEGKPRDYEN
ncbi:MAG: ABC transporter substrate-binding protein, partial [Candidatus Thorarchaeota archaeon]|nr:ABC transporter substrate-binding protein [Candidatus Thorarchaeota archaeon]